MTAHNCKLTHPAPGGHTVRIGPMVSIPAVLRSLGSNPGPVLAGCGYKLAQFEDPDVRVSYVSVSKLLARCEAATNCEHFGLLVGERSIPSHLGIAGYLVSSAPDVGSALRRVVKYLDLHDQGGVATFTSSGKHTLLGYAINLPGVEAAEQIYDLAITIACKIMRALCGRDWNPAEVLLTRKTPSDLVPYKHFFRAPLRFNADESALVFPTRWLSHQPPSADPLLQRHLIMQADELHVKQHNDLVGNLHSLLRQCLMSRQCSAANIASQLGMHERTLNRRLQKEGTSFRQELERVRYTVGQQLLSGTTATLAEIATSLGYADASAFSRAFRQWSSITPAQWRARGASSE
jgi:AraC-like DNA-binding protein